MPMPTYTDPEDPSSDFWGPGGTGTCWCCGHETSTAYLDIGWQHRECDAYPNYTRTGGEGHFLRIRGVEYEVQR